MAAEKLKNKIEDALKQSVDQRSFFQNLLARTLRWPTDEAKQIEDISYAWSGEDLKALELERHVVDGKAWQIQPLEQGQPWGIFVLEFKSAEAFVSGRGMAGVLRKILRGLVSSRRKDAGLPSWKREHLLFICTHEWKHFRFAYFRGKPDDTKTAQLRTFGWGPGTSNRTVCEFNLPALEWPDATTNAEKWVGEWKQAFDKEPLTNDFFKRFDKALDAAKSDLQEFQKMQPAEAYTNAQLLLERLIFLYFLQNRGWLNQDRRYLPDRLGEHATKPEAYTYYRDFLDKVFWTLSSAPGSGGRLPGLPFLNGGLFDDDEFSQPSDQRKTNPPLKVRNATFKYVFDELLEAFNFTVTEDTPLNQEVAVDPEMLGKVFESIVLHAEAADPDAVAPDKRKATGSYYTPRIVVHFICQEVLYQYLLNHLPPLNDKDGWGPRLRTILKIDASDGLDDQEKELLRETFTPEQAAQVLELVKPLRCCDPAVGSGAFPVGLLHELVNLRRVLGTAARGADPTRKEGSDWLQKTKADIVQNCLFGVDIQQQAIEICRLRLWLSLVVDYDLGLDPFTAEKAHFSRAIDGISQLPNLEMNFHRGDSLHDHICGVPTVIMPEKASHYAEDFKKIAALGEQLHQAKKAERKRKLRLQILEKRLDLSRRILEEELKALERSDSALDGLFGITESNAEKRKRIAHEKEQLEKGLEKVESDRHKLAKLERRLTYNIGEFYVELRKLEGADFDSPFNFAWQIDFPAIFGSSNGGKGGFDIIVGNPPFVTARNPTKRGLWRERWPRVCYKNYLLLCPFFELSFGLLGSNAQLGFIVSNAFAKRELGQPLIEDFLSTVEIQKVVDCSGLMFPGHGTPTCLVFGKNQIPNLQLPLSVVGILPGGGDLRIAPEESQLWQDIEDHHTDSGYSNGRIVVSDRSRAEMSKWPWNFIPDRIAAEGELPTKNLSDYTAEPVGAQFITGKDDVFVQPQDYFRRAALPHSQIRAYGAGEDVRDWAALPTEWILFPYFGDLQPLNEPLTPTLGKHLRPYKDTLEDSVISGSIKKKETNLKWFEFRRLARAKFKTRFNIIIPQIATHAHFLVFDHTVAFKEKAQAIALKQEYEESDHHVLTGLLNSSLTLDWLKKECFSKRESEEAETDTYYEFSGGKLEEIPICQVVANALSGECSVLAKILVQLSESCWKRGQRMPALALRKLFEKEGEAYHDWNSQLSGNVALDADLGPPFESTASLQKVYQKAQAIRERLRSEMIALQEEMDWLVYAAYGLLPTDHPAAQTEAEPAGLERELRPFVLWANAEGNYEKAVKLIPSDWPAARQKLWEARLGVIRDNEHIRRIEQPVYKRRWDEQWKVGNQWRCGPVAYAAEFVDAFEWWLREKAEWWLEHKKQGGPVSIEEWTQALWRDIRVQAAWPVAAENYAFVESEKAREKAEKREEPAPPPVTPSANGAGFARAFKAIIEEETVPEGIPFAVPYDDLKAKLKKEVPQKVKSIRGKLNVPRERFHRRKDGMYLWAGLQFK